MYLCFLLQIDNPFQLLELISFGAYLRISKYHVHSAVYQYDYINTIESIVIWLLFLFLELVIAFLFCFCCLVLVLVLEFFVFLIPTYLVVQISFIHFILLKLLLSEPGRVVQGCFVAAVWSFPSPGPEGLRISWSYVRVREFPCLPLFLLLLSLLECVF